MNRIVSFQNVQESPPPIPTTGYFARPGNVWLPHTSGTDANCRMVFRFTDFAVGQGCGATVVNVANAAPFAALTFQDCRVRGGLVSVIPAQVNGPRAIRWVNNIWERATLRVFYYAGSNPSPYSQHAVTVECRNNLFRNVYLPLVYQANNGTPGVWEVKDNLFDQSVNVATTDAQGAARLLRSHNGFTAGTANGLGGTENKTGLDRDYQPGPLGDYYYPVNEPLGFPNSLARLRDEGSRTALLAGLACATTRADHETDNGAVDIGFHYQLSVWLPTADAQTVQTCRNQPLQITLSGSDPCDESVRLTFAKVTDPINGTLGTITQLDATHARVTYTPSATPSPGFCGPDSFTFKVNDGWRDSPPATITVNVGDPNPVAVSQEVMTGKGRPVTLTLAGSGIDECNETLEFAIVPGQGPLPGNSLGAIAAGGPDYATVAYTPAAAFEGTDGFDFGVSDCGLGPSYAHVTIYVAPGPQLAGECRYGSILLNWDITVIQQLFSADFAHGFRVYRSTTATGPYSLLTEPPLGPSIRSFNDTAVTPGVTYYYVVTLTRDEPNPLNPSLSITYESAYSNEVPLSLCRPPPPVPTDVAFIVDNTASMGNLPLTEFKNGIGAILDDIEVISGANYRLALVTPDEDDVRVRIPFSQNNRAAFQSGLNSVFSSGGGDRPESTDECLNTVLNALLV